MYKNRIPKALYILNRGAFDQIYGPEERRRIDAQVDWIADPCEASDVAADANLLSEVELIISGWGAPLMDQRFLDAAPNLKAVFYGAGSVRGFVTDAFWQRGIALTSAYGANAVPVAEFTLAEILFSLKRGWAHMRRAGAGLRQLPADEIPGAYGSTVGIASLGMIGRMVCELLRPFDVRVIAYDPFVDAVQVSGLGAEPVALDALFRESDVVSLHTPRLKETEGMIRGHHFASMRPNATFINTARGAVVAEAEMIAILQTRPDLTAVLDVTWPEPPDAESPLYRLPNVVLTPHIAGSIGVECRRMGSFMADELDRWLAGEPLRWGLTREQAERLA